VQVQLLVWIFVMRLMMVVSSAGSYYINQAIQHGRHANADKMNFEHPLTFLVWLTSIVSIALTFVVSGVMLGGLGDGTLWWKLSAIISCGTLAGAVIPEVIKVFTSTESRHVREIVTASKEAGASLNVVRHHRGCGGAIRPEPDKWKTRTWHRLEKEGHRSFHERLDCEIDRPCRKRNFFPTAQPDLLQMLSHRNTHERAKEVIETLSGVARCRLLQEVIAVLPIAFFPEIRRDLGEIEWQQRFPTARHCRIRDIRQ
jgi:hypothetical protein